ncbi:MAG: glycosyl transferase family 2 [Candidatus Berkelbacteria bacterium Licking1014_85]|uniref:Glycosyl transferase family 2 n=1 Tax=Candidatus Berkelbacteria bacterium Licking1014_85 TaxID=2017148 RepID=A0A554LG31_9BACT|nr:MAG: glycosyl transferase family 2 [Candidatus Berkelbacteria bacterium Licking1014_85]
MTKKIPLTIIILNYNNFTDTFECLKSLRKSSVKFDTFVLDNGSMDDSCEKLKKIAQKSEKIIRSENNLGFAEGNNYCAKFTLENKSEYILLINNDMTVRSNTVEVLYNDIAKNDLIGAISPLIYYADKTRIWYAGGKIDWFKTGVSYSFEILPQNNLLQPTGFCSGGCLIMRTKLFQKLNGFDARYFAYSEDSDLSEKIKNNGKQLFFEPNAIVYHKVNATLGSRSPLQIYYHVRNKFLFLQKNEILIRRKDSGGIRQLFRIKRSGIKLIFCINQHFPRHYYIREK